jgi:hypothetical protein
MHITATEQNQIAPLTESATEEQLRHCQTATDCRTQMAGAIRPPLRRQA